MIRTALRFMAFDRTKSIGIIVGILISTFLIGQQLGIFTFLTGLMASIVKNSQADIWVIDRQTRDANQVGLLDIRNLYEVKSTHGIAEATPIVLAGAQATSENGNPLGVLLIGSDRPDLLMGPNPQRIAEGDKINLLKEGAVSTDQFDDNAFGQTMSIGTRFEINGKDAYVALRTNNLRGFGPPQVYMPISRARYYSGLSPTQMHGILIKADDPASVSQIVEEINQNFPNLRAWARKDLQYTTIREILGSSGIASSTGTLVIFALITGILIIGLTMYSSVLDRIRDYGTMKAIGANTFYLARILLYQAIIFGVIGFLLAWGLLEVFRVAVRSTGLIIVYRWYEILGIFIITSTISIGGMLFALLRVKGVEPASVFRN